MRTLGLVILVACGSPDFADPDAEVTITQGVYGLAISGCDTSDCEDSPYENALITATPTAGGAPVTTTSDGGGFFELALPVGTYSVCVFNCTTITIGNGQRVQRDFISGPGGGIWCNEERCGPGI